MGRQVNLTGWFIYLECLTAEGKVVWGVGIDEDIATASVRAVLSAANAARV